MIKKNICLEHEILRILYTYPKFEIVSTGTFAGGQYPIYKQGVQSCHLDFGTLVDIIVNPDKYKGPNPKLTEKRTTIEEINTTPEILKEIAISVEVLNANGHVRDVVKGTESRHAYLTEEGAIALFKKTYLHEREIRDSTISTNRLSRRVARITIFFVALTAVIGFLQYKKPAEVTKEQFQELIQATRQQQNTQLQSPLDPHKSPRPVDTPKLNVSAKPK
jgi:hypothetical protein